MKDFFALNKPFKKYLPIYMVMLSIMLLLGTSYALLRSSHQGENSYVMNVGLLEVTFVDSQTSSLTLENAKPITDEEGISETNELVFTVKNTGNLVAKYNVYIEETSTSPEFKTVIRFISNKNDTVYNDPKTLADDKYIDQESYLDVGETATYKVKAWISETADATYMNQTFTARIVVEALYSPKVIEPNKPFLLDNMIPVYYDKTSDTEGVWRIADSNNLNETYKWFDYKNFMWANAVTVNKDVMENYYTYSGAETTSDLSVNIATNEEKTVLDQLKNVTFSSTNQSKASSSSIFKLTFHTTSSGTLSFNYTLGSEASYDKLTITINNGSTTTTLVSNKSGSISSTPVSTNLVSGKDYTLTATYSKDGSVDKNGDTATITDLTITSTLSADPVKDTSSTYAWSGNIPTYVAPNKQMASSSYTYNESTGVFTLTNPTSIAYTSSNVNYYTCNSSTQTTCMQLYKILELNANNIVTKVEVHKASNKNFGSSLGQEVKMEDITTMWVWIPRYKYVIWSGNNETSEEQLIKVEFEEGTNTTGTVTCVDNILVDENSSSSETCTDATNGSIINGKSTYTHPAFTFGDTELTGFWYAKFEMSTDQDSTCVTSQSDTNCNKTGQNIYIKPNQISLRYINNANSFVNIRNMELFNNVHGFTQSSSATASSSQTGEITNDTNDYDIHMQKNMEWGAVTYLAYSKYGKYGNSLYTDTYKRVYKNNWYQVENSVFTYKTGYSGYSYNADTSTSNTVLYNDLTDLGSGQGYKGAGASTTGTIYGIYDMNGGSYDSTMGNMVNSSGNFSSSNAGFSSSPLEKYYDKYSYSSSDGSSQTSVSRGKLGDATKELTKGFPVSTGSWEGSYRYLPISSHPWFGRGGTSNPSAHFGGLSSSGTYDGAAGNNDSSRPVLVCSRDSLQ